jgi:hypothetical protein
LKEEALDRTMWTARFGRGFGPVVRQTTKLMNEQWLSWGAESWRVLRPPRAADPKGQQIKLN